MWWHSVPKPEGSLDQPTRDGEQQWIEQTGAQDVEYTTVEVRLQGRAPDAVVIEQPTVVIDDRTNATTDAIYYYSIGCGSGFSPRVYSVDLDATHPALTPVDGSDAGRTQKAQPFPLKISNDDPETLRIQAIVKKHDVHWHLRIPWYSGDLSGTTEVRSEQGPFVIFGTSVTRTAYVPRDDGDGWESQPFSG